MSTSTSTPFDWNSSPLSLEAAQQRRSVDAALRRQCAQEREQAMIRHGITYGKAESYADVSAACAKSLRKRGLLGDFHSPSPTKRPRTELIKEILAQAPRPLSTAEICTRLGLLDKKRISTALSYLAARKEVRIHPGRIVGDYTEGLAPTVSTYSLAA